MILSSTNIQNFSGRDEGPIRIAVSSCLLGQKVRYDGRDKRCPLVISGLGTEFELVAVCPEVAIGLGVPRATIQLWGDPRAPRAIQRPGTDGQVDLTELLVAYGRRMATELADIRGYIAKSKSPSCGPGGVAVYKEGGQEGQQPVGRGVYIAALLASRPGLPVIAETDLEDAGRRARFIARVRDYRPRGGHARW